MVDREKVINALGRCESYGYCEDKQCPYYENAGCLELLRKDTLSMLREQESELIQLREKAENVVVKSSYTLQPFKYRLENATDVESSEFIRANLQRDLIQACEKMGLIAYEKNETKMQGSSPIVKITATLRVHRPEEAKWDE